MRALPCCRSACCCTTAWSSASRAWTAWAELTFVLALYCATSWYTLHLFFVDLRRHFDLGALVLAGDMGMFSLVIYATGGERSWLFFLPLFSVVDQTATSFRRALAFAHLAPLSYLAVIVYIILIDGRRLRSGRRSRRSSSSTAAASTSR